MRQIAVLGMGRFGATIAKTLTKKGVEVIAIDNKNERIEEIKDYVAVAVALDATDEKALRAVGLENVDVAIVCMGEDVEANLLTTTLLKKMGIKKVYARAMTALQEEILKSIEVTKVLNLEEEMGVMVANSVAAAGVEKHMVLAPNHSLVELRVPKSFISKTVREVATRQKYKVNIVAIKKKVPQVTELGERIFKEVLNDVPQPDDVFEEGDMLMVVGSDANIESLTKL
ncbi:MAG: TrkA family potassium uptake protein [Candidatus Omnitrophota bacterium]